MSDNDTWGAMVALREDKAEHLKGMPDDISHCARYDDNASSDRQAG
jgi:hypothetical protein